MTQYHYSNTSVQTTLTGSIIAGDTTLTVADATGLPGSFPYSIILDYQAATVEVVTVTSASGATLTVTRGQDGTSAQSHSSGAVVVHGVVARDLQAPQDHIAANGNVHGVGVSASVVGTDTAQTLTNKTISGSSNTLSNIGNASITDLAASKLTGNYNGGANFAGTVDGTVVVTATGTATQTGNLLEAYKGASRKWLVDPSGNVSASGSVTATTSVTGTTGVTAGTTVTGQGTGDVVALVADVPNANVSDLLQLKRNSAVKAKVDKDGNATTGTITATGLISTSSAGSTDAALAVKVTGDTNNRHSSDTSGLLAWGPGNTATDVYLKRTTSPQTGLETGTRLNLISSIGLTDTLIGVKNSSDSQYRGFWRASGDLRWGDGTASSDTTIYRTAAGVLASDDIKWNNAGSAETWHGLSLLNSFTNRGAGYPNLSYRRVAGVANTVQLVGQIVTPGSAPGSGTQIATLPSGYRPTTEIPGCAYIGSAPTPLACIVGTDGSIKLFGTMAGSTALGINMFIPLDL